MTNRGQRLWTALDLWLRFWVAMGLCLNFNVSFAQQSQPPANPPTQERKGNVLKILEAQRLELRNEGGEELVILTGNPVKMQRNEELIEAPRVLFNRTAKRLMLSGGVRYIDKQGQLIEADELELNTGDESFEAIEVKIESGDFYLSGPMCQRAAGQILLQQGYVTPCQRCQHDVNDYAFKASEVVLYPGDRIIARGVWVLLKEQPVLYLPVLLMFMNERRPKLEIGQDDTDGVVINAELPYVNDFGLGFSLLRYYERRGWGVGFDHYGIGAAKERYQFMYLPPPVNAQNLPASDARKDGIWKYSFAYELQNPEFSFVGSIFRDDDSRVEPKFVLGGQPDVTDFRIEYQTRPTQDNPEPLYRFTLDGYYDHNPSVLPNERFTPQRLPEVEVRFDRGLQGEFSLTGRVVGGFYSAPSNPLNRSARGMGTYIGAWRLLVEHNSSYRPQPFWPGFSLSLENRFVGQYYNTQNPSGEFERLINWSTSAAIGQTVGPFSIGLRANRSLIEGETPFQFDFLRPSKSSRLEGNLSYRPDPWFGLELTASRDLEAGRYEPPARLTLTSRPVDWFNLTASVGRDLERGRWGMLETNLNLSPQPFSLTLNYQRNLELGLNRQLSGRLSYSPLPFSFGLSTAYRWSNIDDQNATAGRCTQLGQVNCILDINRYDPLELSLAYNPEGNSTQFQHSRDLNNGQAIATRLNVVVRDGDNSFSLNQSLTHLYYPLPTPGALPSPIAVAPPSLAGSAQLTFGLHTFSLSNSIVFDVLELSTSNEGLADFSLSYGYSAEQLKLSLLGQWNYVGNYWINPRIVLTARANEPGYVIQNVSAEYHLPERDNPTTADNEAAGYLRSLNFNGEVELVPTPLRQSDPPGVAFQGSLTLNRLSDGSGRFQLGLTNFGPTFSFLGEEQTRMYFRILWNTQGQDFYLPNLTNTILKPKFVWVMDRCCWALRAEMDTFKQEFKISFVLGSDGTDFLFNKDGITLPGDTNIPLR